MSEIFDEINEELRQEKAQALWKKYSKIAYGVAGLIIVGTVAYQFWNDHQKTQMQEQAVAYEAALAQATAGQNDSAVASFTALANSTSDGVSLVARFKAAELLANNGQSDEAVAIYETLAGNSAIDQDYRDLARLLSVMHKPQAGNEEALIAELQPLEAYTNPWRFLAKEVMAGLALNSGDKARAKEILQSLADDLEAPSDIKARATELLKAIGG